MSALHIASFSYRNVKQYLDGHDTASWWWQDAEVSRGSEISRFPHSVSSLLSVLSTRDSSAKGEVDYFYVRSEYGERISETSEMFSNSAKWHPLKQKQDQIQNLSKVIVSSYF
jgi:hypothetical protein